MLMLSVQNALLFTIQSVFNVFIIIVLFRFLLQLARDRFRDPLAYFIQRATNPVLLPLSKILPTYSNINFAALCLVIALQAVELVLIMLVKGFSLAPNIASYTGLLIWSCGELCDQTLLLLFFATLIQVVYSWLQPGQYNPTIMTLSKITDPIFTPVRRVVPTFGVIDFSPIVVIFLISLSRMLIAEPISLFGKSLI